MNHPLCDHTVMFLLLFQVPNRQKCNYNKVTCVEVSRWFISFLKHTWPLITEFLTTTLKYQIPTSHTGAKQHNEPWILWNDFKTLSCKNNIRIPSDWSKITTRVQFCMKSKLHDMKSGLLESLQSTTRVRNLVQYHITRYWDKVHLRICFHCLLGHWCHFREV